MNSELIRLYNGIRKVNPQIRAIDALIHARYWVAGITDTTVIKFFE